MATLPRARTRVEATAGRAASGANTITLMGPAPLNADMKPRRFGGVSALLSFHGYSELAEYFAIHAAETGYPAIVCALPITTPGAVGSQNTSGNTGSSVVSVAAQSSGVLNEHEGVVTVLDGGTIGTDQIVIGLSLDGGRTVKRVRLGTGNSYVVPYVGVQLSFAAGTLVTGDTVLTWKGTQPQCDSAGVQSAREFLAAGQNRSKSWLVITDSQTSSFASAVLTQARAYDTSNDRFVRARVQVRDKLAYANMAKTNVRMTGAPNVTFSEVGATGDTITRAAGSFLSDNFAVGDMIVVTNAPANSPSNNITAVAKLANVTATVLTLDTDDLAPQGPVTADIVAYPSLTFANSGETITRSRGSWLADGFRVGQSVTISGAHASNNGSGKIVSAVTALVLTLSSNDVQVDDVKSTSVVTITAGETKTAWLTSIESAFATIDSAPEVGLGLGRGRKLSPVTGYEYRRPVQWAAAVREYQHDFHVATWKKDEGSLTGWTIDDADQNLAEYDDRVDGEFASNARFTSFRTWANGPEGVFISQDLTRAEDGSILSYTHNADVTNLARTVVQRETENAIGTSLQLNEDGTATADSLKTIAGKVNAALKREVLVDVGEGVRCSKCVWTPSPDDDLSGVEALLTGTLELVLNGTLHSVFTTIKVS